MATLFLQKNNESRPFFKHPLCKTVLSAVRLHCLWQKGAKILVAVSGGGDSVALLHILYHLAFVDGLSLGIAHVNYHLRGEASDADEALVRTYATDLNIPIFVLSWFGSKVSQEQQKIDENTLRDVRYDFFRTVAQKEGYDYIAIGHSRDDSVETVLFHLIRGTGLCGVQGIVWKRENIIRPLLGTTREELRRYLVACNILWREDISNIDTCYTRNRIRNELLPILRTYNPNVDEAICRFSEDATSFLMKERRLEKYSSKVSEPSVLVKKDTVHKDEEEMGCFFVQHFLSLDKHARYTFLCDLVAPFYQRQNSFFSGQIFTTGRVWEIVKMCMSTKSKKQIVLFSGLKFVRKGDKVYIMY